MITSAKNYTKQNKTKQKDSQNSRTNGKSKLYRQKSHKEVYIYTLTKRGKEKKYIYIKGGEQPNQ